MVGQKEAGREIRLTVLLGPGNETPVYNLPSRSSNEQDKKCCCGRQAETVSHSGWLYDLAATSDLSEKGA